MEKALDVLRLIEALHQTPSPNQVNRNLNDDTKEAKRVSKAWCAYSIVTALDDTTSRNRTDLSRDTTESMKKIIALPDHLFFQQHEGANKHLSTSQTSSPLILNFQ